MQRIRVLFLATGLAVGAFGQPSIFPASVKIGATAGSIAPVTETASLVSSGSFGQYLDYDLSIRYWSSTVGWLSVSPVHGTTPTTFTITADPSNLPAGTYSAYIDASVGAVHAGALTTVTFIVAPAISNPGGLAVSPSSLTALGASPSSQTISVMNAPGGTGALPFSVFANPSDRLIVTQSAKSTPASVTVQPMTNWWTAGTHTGSVTVTESASGKSTVVPVTFVVPESSTGPKITITPAQSALLLNYQLNSDSNNQQTVYVSTNSTQYLNVTATSLNSWIGVASASYLTPASTTSFFAPGPFYVSVDPTGLTAGVYKGTVTLSSAGIPGVDIPVTLTVSLTAVLNANPSFVALDETSGLLTSNLAVTSSNPFVFTATTSASWLSITPTSAVASNYPADVTITANTNGLSAGTYQGIITLAGPGGKPSMTIPVQLRTNSSTTSTKVSLQLVPASLKFRTVSGAETDPQYVQITSGSTSLNLTVAAVSDTGWLNLDHLSGMTPMVAKVTANCAMPAGSYSGSLLITSLETGDQSTIAVTFDVTARALTAVPAVVTFAQQAVGAALPPQQLQVTANVPSAFRIVSQPTWIKITPTAGLATPANLTITADPGGLAPGSYEDSILLTGPNDIRIPVAITIAAPARPTAAPASIVFNYELGSPPPQAQTIQISAADRTIPYSISTSTASGVNWLVVNSLSGTTPGAVTVTVNRTQLVPGQQSGAVTIKLEDAAGMILTVPVTVTVTGTPVHLESVLNAATFAPSSIAPGEIVTLTGFGFGPDVPVVARPSSAGAYEVSLAGTSVRFDDVPAPLLMVQNGQINAIVPYALQGRSSAKIQVQAGSSFSIPIDAKIESTSPGIFTTASGRWQAAALNADYTPNSALNPAPRASIIVVYMTGEGQTDPPGQDGRIIATDLRKPILPVKALIGGQPAEVLYAGSAPTMVSGVCQVNVLIPESLHAGTQALEIQIGGVSSQRGVTVEVR